MGASLTMSIETTNSATTNAGINEALNIRFNSFQAAGAKIPDYFEGPNLDNDSIYENMSFSQQLYMDNFVEVCNMAKWDAKHNGIPQYYAPRMRYYANFLRRENAPINMEDLYALDTAISYTVWMVDVTNKIPLPTKMSTRNGGKRWELKDYLVQSEEYPKFSRQFQEPKFIRIKESSAFTNMIGLYLGVSIPFTEIEESRGGLWSPESVMMQELATKMGLQRGRTRLLGTACKNAKFDDSSTADQFGITGLFNYASIQAFNAGNGDQVVTTAGDVEYGLKRNALPLFKTVYKPGEMIIISTSGYATEPFIHRDTYQQELDIHRLKEIVGPGKLINRWICTDELYASTPSATEQQVMLLKNTGDISWVDVYPMQTIPSNTKLYEGDIVNVMLWGGGVQYKTIDTTENAVPAAADTSVDASSTGMFPEGFDVGSFVAGFQSS